MVVDDGEDGDSADEVELNLSAEGFGGHGVSITFEGFGEGQVRVRPDAGLAVLCAMLDAARFSGVVRGSRFAAVMRRSVRGGMG